jgi:magnesium chelatase family protein
MVVCVATVALKGIEVIEVEVQVQLQEGLPAFTIVGLPDKAVAESRERVRGALLSLGTARAPKRISVNLAPADVAKEGSHFDLPDRPWRAGRHRRNSEGGVVEMVSPGRIGVG